jgi:hypothetical protein
MLERAIRLSLLVTSVLCSTVHPPPLSLALELRQAPPADTRRAGLSDFTRACARGSSNVCTLYLVFKEPRLPAALTVRRPRCDPTLPATRAHQGQTSELTSRYPLCQPLFRSPKGRFQDRASSFRGFQGAYLAARALDRGHRVKRVSPIYGHQPPMSTGRSRKSRVTSKSSATILCDAPAAPPLTLPRSAPGAARVAPSATPPASRPACRPWSSGDDRQSPVRRSGRRRPA